MVTVVDAAGFAAGYWGGQSLQERGEALGDDDLRTVTDLLVEQVEFADVIVLNKTDLVDAAGLREAEGAVRALNPRARIVRAVSGVVPLDAVLDTGLFDPEEAARSAGWIRELQGEHTPETEAYGFTSFTYRTAAPFDAERLWQLFHDPATWRGVLRSKGFFWVAQRPLIAFEWAQAGRVSSLRPAGRWWVAMDREEWPSEPGSRPDEAPGWDPVFGDRCQELVFIGQRLDAARIRSSLDACLLPPALVAAGEALWVGLPCPFPESGDGEEDEDEGEDAGDDAA